MPREKKNNEMRNRKRKRKAKRKRKREKKNKRKGRKENKEKLRHKRMKKRNSCLLHLKRRKKKRAGGGIRTVDWRIDFLERESHFSLRSRLIRSSDFFGPKSKVVLHIEDYT